MRTVFGCVCVSVCADGDLQAKFVPSLDGLNSQSHVTENQVLTMQCNLLNNEQGVVWSGAMQELIAVLATDAAVKEAQKTNSTEEDKTILCQLFICDSLSSQIW